jgi:hypothetical protein
VQYNLDRSVFDYNDQIYLHFTFEFVNKISPTEKAIIDRISAGRMVADDRLWACVD